MNYKETDKNFIYTKKAGHYVYRNCLDFTLEGFAWHDENNNFHRLPERIYPELREDLICVANNSAGGVIRFKTNSKSIALRCSYEAMRDSSGMPNSAESGFDLYRKDADGLNFVVNIRPEPGEEILDMTADVKSHTDETEEYYLYMPVYSAVKELEIGFEPGSIAEPAEQRPLSERVVFYGSSITNGGCTSRPGMTYPAVFCREFDTQAVNLGFSGNALGEAVIADEISRLDCALIVVEYDHNNTLEGLKETHEPFIRHIRKNNKNVPIIVASRVVYADQTDEEIKRRDVIYNTYKNAVENGDNNIYFLDGAAYFPGKNRTDYTADGVHPNDAGFKKMADCLAEFCRKNSILKR